MKKRYLIACLLIIILVLTTGCENKTLKNVITLEATKEIDLSQGKIVGDATKPIDEPSLPKNYEVKELIKQNNVLIDWHGYYTTTDLSLAIGKQNNAIISFCNDLDNQKENIEITTANTILTGYIYDSNNVLLITSADNNKLIIECYSYYGDKRAEYKFNHVSATDYQTISCDIDAFYLTYKLNNQIHIDTFKINDKSITLVEKNKFRTDIVEVLSDKSTIFLKRKTNKGFYLDITNKQLAVIDILKVNKNAEISAIKYQRHGEESKLKLYLRELNKIKEYEIKQENNYYKLCPHTILESKIIKQDDRYQKHFVIYDSYYGIFENGIKCDLKYDDVYEDSYSTMNFYKIESCGYIITNHNYDVSYLLTNNADVDKFMRVNDYYVGLNENNEICDVYAKFSSEVLNEKFLGEKFENGFVFVNKQNNKLYYLNKADQAVYSIDSNRNKQLVSQIPSDIWQKTINENTNSLIFADNNMVVLLNTFDTIQSSINYYNLKTKSWHYIVSDFEIYYQEGQGILYNKGRVSYKLNPKTNKFERYYRKYHEYYKSLIVNDILYVNNNVCYENDKNIDMQANYVKYKTNDNTYRIIDIKKTESHTVMKQYYTAQLLNLTNSGFVKPFSTAVRAYDLSKDGILYTGFGDEAILYYYNFKSAEVSTLYNKGLIADLAIKDNYAYFVSLAENKRLIKLNITTGKSLEIPINDKDITFKLAGNYLAISSMRNNKIKIVDINEFAVTDIIDGNSFIWHDNKLIYECGGYLVSYNPLTKQMIIIKHIGHASPFVIHKENVYYYLNGKEERPISKISLTNKINLPIVKDADYILIKSDTNYTSNLIMYDNNHNRLSLIVSGARIKYQINNNCVKYKKYDYENNKWQQEWNEYKVESNKVIKEASINDIY